VAVQDRQFEAEPLRVGRGWVRREPLFDRLGDATAGGVVLVCAPAGSGKTVLLRSWVQATGLRDRVGWVSVERGERDAQRFWLSVIDALALAVPWVERVDPAPSFRGEAVVDQLLAELDLLAEPAVLVIDDLHELHSADALSWLDVFLNRLPPTLRVVLATREDPPLRLHRLRLAGELTELRAHDLRFSQAETKELLAEAGIALSDAGVARLYERTEGWVAGLRLAVISLARHPDPEQFVIEFSGSERTVAGYLLAEVLERQPADVREMLLRTSVLERVSGPLADHLTGASGSERILLELEDANAFVTSLDVGRTWFRYHHLFADLLQLELRRTEPTIVDSLHRAAAEWHEREGHVVEAIRHAQAARDWSLATRALTDHHADLALDGRAGTVRQLLAAFAPDMAARDAELALVFALVRLLDGGLDDSAAYVDVADGLADTVPSERRVRFELLRAVVRLAVARWRGDLQTAVDAMRTSEAALATQPVSERALSEAVRAAALLNLGVAELWSARLGEARRHLELSLEVARRARRPWLTISPLGHLAFAAPWTGRSCSAGLALAEEAVHIADAHGWSEDLIVVTPLAAGALNLLWLGRLDEAEQWLARAQSTLQPDGEPGTELIVHSARGLLRLAHGRLEDALSALGAARRMETLLTGRHAYAIATRARMLQAQARMDHSAAARATLAELSEQDRDTSEMRLAEAVIALAEGEPAQALDVLGPVIERSAPAIHRAAATIEAQVLEAAAHEALGDERAAEAALERALDVAEPEGIVLPFILHPLPEALGRLRQHRTAHAALRQAILDMLVGAAPRSMGPPAVLRDELSDAELRVVRYLPSNLKASEIAAELFVSTNTIRTHLRHIYAKLDAHGRAEAVTRARELGLLAPAARLR
jgi:LuxR family maltose regulon positive regulatory protein